MITLLRIEALKLRTTRTICGLLAAAFGLCALDALLAAVQADSPAGGGFAGIKPLSELPWAAWSAPRSSPW